MLIRCFGPALGPWGDKWPVLAGALLAVVISLLLS